MSFCDHLQGSCQRELWSAVPAAAFVALVLAFSLPLRLPKKSSDIFKRIQAPFLPTLTLAEVEELELERSNSLTDEVTPPEVELSLNNHGAPKWRTVLFKVLALVEVALWLFQAILNVVCATRHLSGGGPAFLLLALPFLTAATWIYALVRVVHRPPRTPPYDLFILSILRIFGSILTLGGQLYAWQTWSTRLPSAVIIAFEAVDLGITAVFLALIMSLPLNIPGIRRGTERAPSPEDYTSLAGWVTFSWINPLVNVGRRKTLNDEDVWDISPTLKSRFTFMAYHQNRGSSVLWKLLRANSMDLIINFVFSIVSVFLDFSGPYFLRLILMGLENPAPGSRNQICLYATVAFGANLLNAQVKLQHLWYARRATSRINTQLSAAIYDKALRIKDQSGVVSATDSQNSPNSGKDTKSRTKNDSDAKKAGADVGKIVNLMGIDCMKLMKQVSAMPAIYGAPFQLVLSCVYLYSILGPSSFAGFISLVFAFPLSKLLARMTVHIAKGTLAAKDSRMKMVNEMFDTIKFIKFFTWENQWITRVIGARDVEIVWLKKARTLRVYYTLLWSLVPTMVSILSFFVYVYTGHELNASTAFTAIRVFEMLKMPLSALPYGFVTMAETKVSLDRLNTFFNEDEVPDDVSSLTRPGTTERQDLKLENATFRWTATQSHKSTNPDVKVASQIPDANLSTVSHLGLAGEDSAALSSTSVRTVIPPDMNNVFELRDISLQFSPGKLTVVTGPTASGKTALLLALLGEMDRVSGASTIPKNPTIVNEHGLTNSISYAAQTPWLQQQSIKDNIIFGYPVNEERYHAVVEACTLRPDFDMLEDGDSTEIGSKGVQLSGGQKARVALARAVYAPTEYLIMDDIFSAVDSHTARSLFNDLLKGPLVEHRNIVLVTHHLDLVLSGAHYLVQLIDGRIIHQGTVEELTRRGLIDHIFHDMSMHAKEGSNAESQAETSLAIKDEDTNPVTKARKLVEEEVRAEGTVKWSIYHEYLKASSYWTWSGVLLGIVIVESFNVATRLWVSIWGNNYNQPMESFGSSAYSSASRYILGKLENWSTTITLGGHSFTAQGISIELPDAHFHPLFYAAVYCAICVAAALVDVFTQWLFLTGGLRAGRVLFRSLLTSLSAATFRFYDTTPTGRILNRFGKDFDTFDAVLPYMLHHSMTSLAAFLAAMFTVIAIVPWFLPISAGLAYWYVRLSIGYLTTGRDLRRMESTSRSPILSGFSDLLAGIVTVRAFSSERRFLEGHYKRIDSTNRFYYFIYMLNRWLLFRFDALGAASIYVSTLFVLWKNSSVGLAGLTIVSAMTFSSHVYWACRWYIDLELCLNSVERVVEFLDIPKEPPAIIESNRVPAYWPSSSDSDSLLVVEDLEVKYAPELPSVLHGVSFSLKARERVGLLGRTGSGKSTLAMSILRFIEPIKGRIIIDGIDIATIGTQDLRSRVTFIAQDQALFLGNVRYNLDPFDEHSDAECLDALARVHLTTSEGALHSQKNSRVPSRTPSVHDSNEDVTTSLAVSEVATQVEGDGKIVITLDTKVSAGGQNFSNGQRQLLAMARALLQQSAVVILDEATSSIDKATDVKIQAAIREEFHSSLLLTIAHRLDTVIDFDRLVVLDKGRIVEFDTPFNLIHKPDGVFREMCIQSGSFKELEATARAHAN